MLSFFNKDADKKIGIFYICTGKYGVFWKKFYESCEQYFCPGLEKHYFIFSDDETLEYDTNKVTMVHQEKLGWPYDTLMRFHMFNRVEEQAIEYDYLFFFNANMVFLKTVKPKNIFPTEAEGLVGVRHPFYYEGTVGAPFETNTRSTAFAIHPKHYLAGGLSGGIAKKYMEMSLQIAANIDKDEAEGIIAIWHDESHINAYFAQLSNYKVLDPGYIVPEFRLKNFPFKPYITVLDKQHFGDLEYLRNS